MSDRTKLPPGSRPINVLLACLGMLGVMVCMTIFAVRLGHHQRDAYRPVDVLDLPAEVTFVTEGQPIRRQDYAIQVVVAEGSDRIYGVILDSEKPLPRRFKLAKRVGFKSLEVVSLEESAKKSP